MENGKVDINELSDDDFVYVDASVLGKNVCVKTTHKEIKDAIIRNKSREKDDLKNISNKIYREIQNINADKLVKEMESGREKAFKEWDDLCADILIILTIHFVLYNREIPICDMKVDLPALGKK